VTGAREPAWSLLDSLDYYDLEFWSRIARWARLGYLFRNIHLDDLSEPSEGFPDATPEQTPLLGDVISQAIAPLIEDSLGREQRGERSLQPLFTENAIRLHDPHTLRLTRCPLDPGRSGS
jgi:hypothetical protein